MYELHPRGHGEHDIYQTGPSKIALAHIKSNQTMRVLCIFQIGSFGKDERNQREDHAAQDVVLFIS